jgi:hypothetical protein
MYLVFHIKCLVQYQQCCEAAIADLEKVLVDIVNRLLLVYEIIRIIDNFWGKNID